ncbi:MAG: YdcH family protein [Deltaproteobacteria bacterium]|nr:YdcH family protein [Deltaproteobacteria bacterium]
MSEPAVKPDPLARLQALREEHRSLDTRIQEMSSRAYLTPDDQVEIARLKKLKLKKKDEILTVASQAGVEI